MKIASKLTFHKCFFCNKNFNKLQLTEINNNTVLINEEELSYIDLIFDICLLKLEDNKKSFVCNECNTNLLSFHFFKREAKKYSNFRDHLEKLEILAKLETFLCDAGELSSLQIIQNSNSFTVLLHKEIIEQIEQEEIITEIVKEEGTQKIEVIENHSELIEYDDGEIITQELEIDQEFQLIKEPEAIDCDEYSIGKIEWINAEMKKCEEKKGRQSTFNCSICSTLFKTASAMTDHLENIHINPINHEKEKIDELDDEELEYQVRACRYTEMFVDREEMKWRCSLCQEKRVYSNEHAFRLHYLITHRRSESESPFVQPQLYHDETWIEETDTANYEDPMSVHEGEDDTEYLISEAESPSIKKRKINTLNDLNEEQISWIRKEAAAGEKFKGKKKVYFCTVCDCQLTTPASLTRHLRDMHVLKKEKDEKTILKNEVKNSKLVIETENGSKTIYKCQQCENERFYQSEQAFKLHLRMIHIRTTKVDAAFVSACKTTIVEGESLREAWKCPSCERVFKHRDTLRNHIKLEHPNMNETEGRKMLKKTESVDLSKVHPMKATKLEQKFSENSCNECGLKFIPSQNQCKSKIHRDCHEVFRILAPQASRFKCEPCRTVFNSEASCEAHINLHGTPECDLIIEAQGLSQYGANFYKDAVGDADDAVDEAVWKCGHCNVRYFDENDCLSHIMLLHSAPLCCFIDNREFNGSVGLSKYTQHMKNKHPELFSELKYPCGVCKLTFPTIYEKLAHQKDCEAKKLQCDHCGKRFAKKYQLQAHILYELGLSGYSCEYCGKRCKTFSDLKIHSNVHSLARPYECSQCSKTFKTPGARSSHMEGHNIEGIYCEICGTKLASRTLYQRHKRYQHNIDFREKQMRKYYCTRCVKHFLRPSMYRQHMKLSHNIDV